MGTARREAAYDLAAIKERLRENAAREKSYVFSSAEISAILDGFDALSAEIDRLQERLDSASC
jgi:ubiquinone biosynthesis protein UbiJ